MNENSERKRKMDKFCAPYNFTTDWTGAVVFDDFSTVVLEIIGHLILLFKNEVKVVT